MRLEVSNVQVGVLASVVADRLVVIELLLQQVVLLMDCSVPQNVRLNQFIQVAILIESV